MALHLTAGNVADCQAFDDLYLLIPEDNVLEHAALDKGYDSDAIRDKLGADGISPEIPSRRNRKEPPPYDRDCYKLRNQVERFFNRLKHFRKIATRYDKLKITFAAFVQLASAFIALHK